MITLSTLLSIPHIHSQNLPQQINSVVIDSRTVQPGSLFVAIKGERHDAHNFIAQVLESGAAACVVNETWYNENGSSFRNSPLLVVADTTLALGHLATAYRRKFKIPVVAIAGSNGKTSTKELTAHLLEQQYQVLKTEGNYNNHIGVPLTLFRLKPEHQIAIVEIGTNHFGEIDYLCKVLEPTHGLITNIGQEHLEFFKDLEGVAKAEGELFDYLAAEKKMAFVNVDDEYVAKLAGGLTQHVSYGLNYCAEAVGKILKISKAGQAKAAFTYDDIEIEAQLQVPGLHSAINALAAFTVAASFGVPANLLKKGLESYRSANKRMEVLEVAGVTLLNDCYNANPDSMRAALQTLGAIGGSAAKYAVIGDMAELGNQQEELHRGLAEDIRNASITHTYTFGQLAEHTHLALQQAGLVSSHYQTKPALVQALKPLLKTGDIVLIKGSRSAALEEVTQLLQQ